MKSICGKYLPGAFTGFLLILSSFNTSAWADNNAPTLQLAWQVTGIDTPESVLEVQYKREHFFLVSAIEGDFLTKDGKGSIVKMDDKGRILNIEWAKGLNAPKGMASFKDKLYVADIDEVVIISLTSGKIQNKLPIPNAIFLNDVTVDNKGAVYVSDTATGQVFRINGDNVELYLENLPSANGLLFDKNKLMVGAGADLIAFDSKKNPTVMNGHFPYDIDGITSAGCNTYFVSAWPGQIYWVDAEGEITVLLDSVSAGINTADITYSKPSNLLLVPNFFSHTVTSYKVLR